MARTVNKPSATFKLEPDMLVWVKAEAVRQSTSASAIARQAIRAFQESRQQNGTPA